MNLTDFLSRHPVFEFALEGENEEDLAFNSTLHKALLMRIKPEAN